MPKVKVCIKEDTAKVALTELELDDPGPGQVLVRTTLTTICGSDIHMADDIPEIPLGMPMGHEAVGIVEAVGDGVERFKTGERVVACCLMSCGHCVRCAAGDPSICATFGAPLNLLFGAQAEMFLIGGADYSVQHVPATLSDQQAIFVADILSTGFGACERAELQPGQSVAIFGQGPVGLCATMGARYYGAEPIIAVEGVAERGRMAQRLGAHHVVGPERAVEEIMELTGGVDVAIEALGKQVTFENCCRVARLGGTISSVGAYGGITALSLPTDGNFVHRKIVTSFCPAGADRLAFLLGLIEAGTVDPTPLITHERRLDEIVDAYDLFRRRADGVIKIAIS